MRILSGKLLFYLYNNKSPNGDYLNMETTSIAKILDVEFDTLVEAIKELELLEYILVMHGFRGIKITEQGYRYCVIEGNKNRIGF